MIHAYLFVTHRNTDRDGHGPEFQKHMKRINEIANTHITIYHSFFDEYNKYIKFLYLYIYIVVINIGGNVMESVVRNHPIMV